MAKVAHLEAALRGTASWEIWRRGNPGTRADLSGADLSGADLSGADLSGADLSGANLSAADLAGAAMCGRSARRRVTLNAQLLHGIDLGAMSVGWADLARANLTNASLCGADLSGANLRGARMDFARADRANFTWANLDEVHGEGLLLTQANLFECNLIRSELVSSDLAGADLRGAKLEGTRLHDANLTGANLCRALIIDADLSGALLDGAFVHGTSAWNVQGSPRSQKDLVITRSFPPYNEPLLTVDDLKVAQFIYLLLSNQSIRDVIDTITSKAVLILGRFAEPRKAVLEALREALRRRGFLPIMFDFSPSPSRDLTETVVLLAGLARFVIADLTDARSIPQELSHIVPVFASLPVVPIIQANQLAYAMFEHWVNYASVLPLVQYRDVPDLIARLDADVIAPVEGRRLGGDDEIDRLRQQVVRLQEERDELSRALQQDGLNSSPPRHE